MRVNLVLLIVGLIVSLSPLAWAQEPPSSPHEEARRILRQRLSADEKRGATNVAATARVFNGSFPWFVSSAKLLDPGVGWASTGHGLLWTEDGGKVWKNITPSEESALPDPFFLDRHRGWVLSLGCSADNPKKLEVGFNLAATADAGATWSSVAASPLTVTDYGNSDRAGVRGCEGDFAFVDSLHGWINVTASGETMNSRWAFLLTTSDGGRTWKRALHAPALPWGKLLLVTPRDGWLLGGPGDGRLFATHDSANSWWEVKVKRPNDIGKEDWCTYTIPTFRDAEHGFLPVSYHEGLEASTTVLFKTNDGGRTWKPDRRVSERDEEYGKDVIVGDAWILATQIINETDHHHTLMLKQVGAGEKVQAQPASLPIGSHRGNAMDLTFITPAAGWVRLGNGELLSTTDGGGTWTDITPGPKD